MAPAPTIPVRLDNATIERLDALAVAVSENVHGLRVTRSDVMRMVFERGLPVLEAELGLAKPVKGRKGKR